MVLHGERRPDRVRSLAERVFYPLWDARLSLGHAVRTVREALAEANAGIDTATSLLEARLLAGDPSLFEDLRYRLAAKVRAAPADLLRRVARADAERHARHGSAAHLMEPDVKECAGALRDVHSVGWAARALGRDGADALVTEGVLRAAERDALSAGEEFLLRVRSALHLAAGKRVDRLVLDEQPALAQEFGYGATAGLDAADALMRALFEHARHIQHVRELAFERVAERVGGERGRADPAPPSSADEAMEVFARWAEGRASPSASLLDHLEALPLEDGAPWSPGTLRAFLRILLAGETGGRALEAMDRVGLLGRLLPEWLDVRCRPQRDPFHTFTVDVHLLRAAAEVAGLLAGRGADDPLAGEAVAVVSGAGAGDVLFLGAFLHDIGKVGRGGHVETGPAVAASALERMGVEGSARDDALFLVREHLLLSNTATRRDLSDRALIRATAARIGTAERLAMLYLLTVADARATGPHATTTWRMALVRDLVTEVERVLERGEVEETAARSAARAREVRRLLGGEDDEEVGRFLSRMPERYLASVDASSVAEHFRLLHAGLGANEVRTAVAPGAGADTHRLAVVAGDRPGLLAKIAGSLALAGLSILSAEVFTTDDGVVLDLFEVEPAFRGVVDEERWRRFRGDLRRAIEGRISLDYRVAEKGRHYPVARPDLPTSVRVDNEASEGFSVVEVFAPDRVGLLFQVARTFHELELDVHVAKVATYGGRVVDAFYVRDLAGGKVDDEHAAEIERAILARLGTAS